MTYEPPHRVPPRTPPRRKRRRRVPPRPAAHASRHARPPRIAEVYRARRRVLASLYVVLGLLLVAAALTSPIVAVKRVRLAGLAGLPASEADLTLQTAAVSPGTNWLRAPVRSIEERLRALPWVRAASVSRRFPNTVEAQITARQPCVLAQTSAGLFEVDAEGVPIRRARPEIAGFQAEQPPMQDAASSAPTVSPLPSMGEGAGAGPTPFAALLPAEFRPYFDRDGLLPNLLEPPLFAPAASVPSLTGARLPLVTLARPMTVQPGVPLNDTALSAAIDILQSAQRERLVRIAKIEVDQSDNICLNMQDGVVVQLGQAEDFAKKLALVQRIYTWEPDIARRLVAINLSSPAWPAYTPRNPPTSTPLAAGSGSVLR
ncbi:MAG TPA: FtsQ-type POTRA domain-containing protein [Chthonomonadaceae bacterium]|nr:FtsQ-type POTRA domain-containing protein [Chthonomonadaceae bacterium]